MFPEPLYLTALRLDPSLVEDAAQSGVFVLASPATLIVLLKAVAHGGSRSRSRTTRVASAPWAGDAPSDRELAGHVRVAGHQLRSTVLRVIGALENRVLVTARRFSEWGVQNTEEIVENWTRRRDPRSRRRTCSPRSCPPVAYRPAAISQGRRTGTYPRAPSPLGTARSGTGPERLGSAGPVHAQDGR